MCVSVCLRQRFLQDNIYPTFLCFSLIRWDNYTTGKPFEGWFGPKVKMLTAASMCHILLNMDHVTCERVWQTQMAYERKWENKMYILHICVKKYVEIQDNHFLFK